MKRKEILKKIAYYIESDCYVVTKDNWQHYLNAGNLEFCVDDNQKILLRPLSDLTKEIDVNGEKFVPKEKLNLIHDITHKGKILDFKTGEEVEILSFPYFLIEKLIEWHFDVFNLIDEGLAHPLI